MHVNPKKMYVSQFENSIVTLADNKLSVNAVIFITLKQPYFAAV